MAFVPGLFHVLEKLQDALKEMIPDAAPRRSAFGRLKAMIMAGGAALAVNEPAPFGDDCPAVRAFVNCCRPDPHRMRCGECRRRGIPCGSGLVEGGCGTVVADRLKKSGSRWSVSGANAVMALRCCWMNGRIPDFFHWRAAA